MKFPGGFNIQQMMKQAQVMQEKMQKEMEELRVEASAPWGTGDRSPRCIPTTLAQPHIQSGTVRPLAIGGLARDKQYPDLPTVAEQGFPGFEAVSWIGLFAPRGTPRPIVERLNAEVNGALRDPEVAARFAQQCVEVQQSNPDELRKRISIEVHIWTEVARSANIRAE